MYWLSSRAAGTAALLFATLAVLVGALRAGGLAGSERGGRRRLQLAIVHEVLGLAMIVTLLIHGFVLLGDNYQSQTLVDIAIPFVGPVHPVPNGIGIISGYVFMLVSLTYYVRDRMGGEARWIALHRLTLLAWVGSIVHTVGEGTDREQAWFIVILALPAVAAVVVLAMRLSSARGRQPAA